MSKIKTEFVGVKVDRPTKAKIDRAKAQLQAADLGGHPYTRSDVVRLCLDRVLDSNVNFEQPNSDEPELGEF